MTLTKLFANSKNIHQLKNVCEFGKTIFTNSKKLHEFKKYLGILKMLVNSKNIHVFENVQVFKSICEFKKNVHELNSCSQTAKMFMS